MIPHLRCTAGHWDIEATESCQNFLGGLRNSPFDIRNSVTDKISLLASARRERPASSPFGNVAGPFQGLPWRTSEPGRSELHRSWGRCSPPSGNIEARYRPVPG